jgi:hypothetical protein
MAKTLYEATKWGEQEPSVWGRESDKAFKEIKKALKNASALGLLDVMSPFFLYVHEQKGTGTQLPGSWYWLTCQNNLMPFPEAGHLACVP